MKRFLLAFNLHLVISSLIFCSSGYGGQKAVSVAISPIPQGVMEPELVAAVYSGTEKIRYDLSYTGGIKLGELVIEIRPVADKNDEFELYALITTRDSIMNAIYPVRDVHITRVQGQERLPFLYEVWQKEGRNYQAHKLTSYDQGSGLIRYRKNDQQPVEYTVQGKTHNEFSSFFSSRLMRFETGKSFMIPTFADKKRVEVEVRVKERKQMKTEALGEVETVEIRPILPFKGLYDKRGDTVIWYTDDECRVPVKIQSKLAIGSITSTLVSYENLKCSRYDRIAGLKN